MSMYSEGEKGTVWHKDLVYSCTEDEHSPLIEKLRNLSVVQFFANQSRPEGSSIGLICKEGAQVDSRVAGARALRYREHSTQKRKRADPMMLTRVSLQSVQ